VNVWDVLVDRTFTMDIEDILLKRFGCFDNGKNTQLGYVQGDVPAIKQMNCRMTKFMVISVT